VCCCNVLQYATLRCSELQEVKLVCVAVCYSVLYCVAVYDAAAVVLQCGLQFVLQCVL